MKGEITRKYLVPYPKSMTGKQVTGYERSSLLGGMAQFRDSAVSGVVLGALTPPFAEKVWFE